MSTGPKKTENRGGRRSGSGRKGAFSITEQQAKAMLREAKKFAKEKGKTVDQILLGIIYDDQVIEFKNKKGQVFDTEAVEPKTRVAAIKVFKEFTMGKHTEQTVKHQGLTPMIGLPEMKPDPAQTKYPIEGNA